METWGDGICLQIFWVNQWGELLFIVSSLKSDYLHFFPNNADPVSLVLLRPTSPTRKNPQRHKIIDAMHPVVSKDQLIDLNLCICRNIWLISRNFLWRSLWLRFVQWCIFLLAFLMCFKIEGLHFNFSINTVIQSFGVFLRLTVWLHKGRSIF